MNGTAAPYPATRLHACCRWDVLELRTPRQIEPDSRTTTTGWCRDLTVKKGKFFFPIVKRAKQLVVLLALGAGCLTGGRAQALVFYESFDAVTSTIPDGWQVEGNNPAGLDLAAPGGLFGGIAIDLDGTDFNPDAQTPTLSKSFGLTGGTRYNIKFDLLPGYDDNYVDVAFGSYSGRFFRQSIYSGLQPKTHAFDFKPTSNGSYGLSFVNQNIDPSDPTLVTRNVDFNGALLNDVKVWDEFSAEPSPVIEEVPGPLPLLGAIAAFRWSRKLRARVRAGQSSPSLRR